MASKHEEYKEAIKIKTPKGEFSVDKLNGVMLGAVYRRHGRVQSDIAVALGIPPQTLGACLRRERSDTMKGDALMEALDLEYVITVRVKRADK